MATLTHRVLIVDAHKIVRQGLRLLLEHVEDLQVVGDTDGSGALPSAVGLNPDIILMDLQLPEFADGLRILGSLHASVPGARVIVMAISGVDSRLVYQAIYRGAVGYILKTSSGVDEVVVAIRRVTRGQAYLSSSVLTNLVDAISGQSEPGLEGVWTSCVPLSAREEDVLDLVAQGFTNRQIADRLVVSENTVRVHLHNILEKLQLTNRVQAAAFALRRMPPNGAAVGRSAGRPAILR